MKQKLIDGLTTKFQGVDTSIINRVASKLSETVKTEEDVTTSIEGVTLQYLLNSYADSRVSEATHTAIRNERKKLGFDENGNPIKPMEKDKNVETPVDEPAWFKSYREQKDRELAELKSKFESQEQEKVKNALSSKLYDKLKSNDIPEWYLEGRTFAIESEDDIDALVETTKDNFEKVNQKMIESGVIISPPRNAAANPSDGTLGAKMAEKRNTNASDGVKGKEI